MDVQRYKINLKPTNDKFINIPINIDFDFSGRDDAINAYESQVIKEIIGEADDFEINRFSHDNNLPTSSETKLIHEFYFYQNANPPYSNTYRLDFTDQELYYYSNSFTNSFFKLDFYDSPNPNNQTNYLTQIIPVQQGSFETVNLFKKDVKVRIPNFSLDFVGDKEGFFVYWLKKRSFLNIDTFYVSAKFFNAKIGQFVRFLNSNTPTKTFDESKFFYYEYKLNYDTQTYKVFGNGINPRIRRGVTGSPIRWLEYVNP